MKNCLICNQQETFNIYQSKNNTLARYGFLESQAPSNIPKTNDLVMDITFCNKCKFAWNESFQYSLVDYSSDKIIEAGNFSKRYYDYQIKSAKDVVQMIGHVPEEIVEIGAGSGIFIDAIKAHKKIAIEPSEESKNIDKSIQLFNCYYEKDKFNFPAELIVMRQVLEHIQDPLNFLKDVLASFESSKNYLYIEVPNSYPAFRDGRFYDFYYEHCNYFTTQSLIELCSQLGLVVVNINSAMDGELISILMTTKEIKNEDIEKEISDKEKLLSSKLELALKKDKKILGWGASGNGVQILNKLKLDNSKILAIIDSDKNKQGLFIPGTMQKIISPNEAIDYKPAVIIIFTQFHKKEIEEQCKEIFKEIDIIQV